MHRKFAAFDEKTGVFVPQPAQRTDKGERPAVNLECPDAKQECPDAKQEWSDAKREGIDGNRE